MMYHKSYCRPPHEPFSCQPALYLFYQPTSLQQILHSNTKPQYCILGVPLQELLHHVGHVAAYKLL